MSITNPSAPQSRRTRSARIAIGVTLGLIVVVAPLAFVALDDGARSSDPRVKTGALAAVRAAIGQTAAATSYEMDTETTTSQPARNLCDTSRPTCVTSSPNTNRFNSHSIVNREPYAMVSYTRWSSFGDVTLHVNSTRVWQSGGATVGYGAGKPGVSLPDYAQQVLGTLGPGPGALAMISIASRGGYLALEEQAVATARPAGTGTVDNVAVTYYDVTIDITKLADAPDLNDVQRSTIDDALPILKQSGYSGTAERIGIDDDGFVREITATTKFEDGATTERYSVLSNFGCAPAVTMPNEPPPSAAAQPCVTGAPATTALATVPTTSASSSTTTSSAPTTTATTTPTTTSTLGTTKPPSGSVAVQVLNGSGVLGAATARTNDLAALGWQVLPPGNAWGLRTGTAIQCAQGFDLAAVQLGEILARFGVPTTREPFPFPTPPSYDASAVCYVILGT